MGDLIPGCTVRPLKPPQILEFPGNRVFIYTPTLPASRPQLPSLELCHLVDPAALSIPHPPSPAAIKGRQSEQNGPDPSWSHPLPGKASQPSLNPSQPTPKQGPAPQNPASDIPSAAHRLWDSGDLSCSTERNPKFPLLFVPLCLISIASHDGRCILNLSKRFKTT